MDTETPEQTQARRRAEDASMRRQRIFDAEHQLRAGRRALDHIDVEREILMYRRDRNVQDLRAAGYTWDRIAELAGVSRATLMERRLDTAGQSERT